MTSLFQYRAVSAAGRLQRGTVKAASAHTAEAVLTARGLHPISVVPDHRSIQRSTVPLAELALVFRSLASLRAAGVPLDQAIRSTCPLASARLRGVLEDARISLAAGKSLEDLAV